MRGIRSLENLPSSSGAHNPSLVIRWAGLQKPGLWLSVWLFTLASTLVLLWLGYSLYERVGLFFGLAIAVSLNALLFVFGDSNLVRFYKAKRVRGQDPWMLGEVLSRQSNQMNLSPPSIYIFDCLSANAFTIGIPWRPSAIGLSSGLLEKMSFKEREAIIAYLLVQIKLSETFFHGVVTILNNAITGLAQTLDKLWVINFFFDRKQRPVVWMLSPVSWLLTRLVRPPQSYFRMDAMTGEQLGNRSGLAHVLWRLQGLSETCPLEMPPSSSHHFIVNPESPSAPIFFERTHPPMKLRLERLVGFYPI